MANPVCKDDVFELVRRTVETGVTAEEFYKAVTEGTLPCYY